MITVLSICRECEAFTEIHAINTHIRFGSTQLELNETDLGLFHPCRTPGGDDNVLVEDDTLHEFSVFNGTANLFNDTDIPQIDIRGGLCDEAADGLDGDGSKGRGIL